MTTAEKIAHLEEIPVYYSGIGSRSTPGEVLYLMRQVAVAFARAGLVLRSGHAEGADQAFEHGAMSIEEWKAEIFLPWDGFNDMYEWHGDQLFVSPSPSPTAYEIAERFHPNWAACGRGARALHARNSHQVLGQNPDHPVLSTGVVCWTPDGSLDGRGPRCGGTGQALRIASAYGVHVTNLARPDHREFAERWLSENTTERRAP